MLSSKFKKVMLIRNSLKQIMLGQKTKVFLPQKVLRIVVMNISMVSSNE